MEKSAVEWLVSYINTYNNKFSSAFEKEINQAKEMEKQQQGYSEEEVENILIEYVKTNPSKPYRVLSWFQQFKNK
jgi:arginyl-tRNA synthetase